MSAFVGGATSKVQGNAKARMENTKNTLTSTVGNLRLLVSDLKERFDLTPDKEPKSPKPSNSVIGLKTNVPGAFFAVFTREKDILSNHAQNFAHINRNWVSK